MDAVDTGGPPPMSFAIAGPDHGTVVVTIRGELDIANIDELAAAVGPMVDDAPQRLILDVGELRFADSSAIALWVRWSRIVGELQVRGASDLLARVIGAMGLTDSLRLA